MTCKKFQTINDIVYYVSDRINKINFNDCLICKDEAKISITFSINISKTKTMKLKELPIGSIVKYKGLRLRICEAVQQCRGCYFRRYTSCPVDIIGVCCHPWREQDIILRKIDKNKKENNHIKYKKK